VPINLSTLLSCLPESPLSVEPAGADPEITGIAFDSRRVRPGDLFVAVWHPSYTADRHAFAGMAVANGAAAIVAQKPVRVPPGTPVVMVRHTPSALGWLAAGFYGVPSSRLGLASVTGTDGKTTTVTLATAILEAAGFPTGMVTTVATKTVGPVREKQEHTSTPEAVELQALLADTVAGGGRRAVVEATSHALDQDRLTGCELDVAVVTRVTHEHLEYHGTYERYLAAKARLIDLLRADPRHPKIERVPKEAVLNADDQSFDFLAARARAVGVPVIRYGLHAEAEVRALDVQSDGWATRCRVMSPWGEGNLTLQLPGSFNVYNALAALAAGCTLGAPLDGALRTLAEQRGVSGRMERIDCGQPFTVVVDFAHTPDSLTQVLTFLRPLTRGRLIVVFGSAGERDRDKRPWMGRIAALLADYAIFADEDPRLEDREQIIAEIAKGAMEAGAKEDEHFARVADRRMAIAAAFQRAQPGDTVLLAGKGHEQSIIGALDGKLHTFPWDERTVAREELRKLGYGAS
jgi:UDP-N-acetylmuramoyl-L-alanyl-D-glutamate--2,6-diaminopimelate ligase